MLQSIQILRGAAAIMVVFFHYMHLVKNNEVTNHWIYSFGGSGVDIFFVISGFIMMVSHYHATQDSAYTFLIRRFVRIVPLYWVLTIIAFFSALMLAPTGVTAQLGFKAFWMSMVFLPYSESYVHLDPAAAGTYVLPMAWTLAFEWYFYILFAVSLVLKLKPTVRWIFLFLWFTFAIGLGYIFQPENLVFQIASNAIALEFLLGCLIAIFYKENYRIDKYAAGSLAVVGLLMVVIPAHFRVLQWGGGAFALICAATLYKKADILNFKLAAWFGDVSYSLYLSHFFAIGIYQKIQNRFAIFEDASHFLSILLFILIALAATLVCFYGIENPARRFFARRRRTIHQNGPAAVL